MPVSGSTVVRRQLGRWLRELRDAAGKAELDVEEASVASRAKLWRIETGRVAAKIGDVRALCWLYGTDTSTMDALARLAVATKGHGWWEDYDVTPVRYGLHLGLEQVAESLVTYDPERVHPLLQTPEYMRALYLASHPDADERAIRSHLKFGHDRQRATTARTLPMRLTAVIGESALARPVGSLAVMAAQAGRLEDLARRQPHIDIRVLPLQVGAHPAMQAGPFNILDFTGTEDPSVVHVEAHSGACYLERPSELAEYRRVFNHVYGRAVSINEFRLAHGRARPKRELVRSSPR